MVTLALFDTLMALHNEQLITEIILKYLIGAPHIPIAQKHKINKIQSYAKTVDYFLDLAPDVMKNSNKILAEHNSMDYQQQQQSLTAGVSRTIGANWNHYGLHSGDSLYSNYHAYLYDAHQKIKRKKQACDQWNDNYFYKIPVGKDRKIRSPTIIPNSDQLVQTIRNFLTEFNVVEDQSSNNNNVVGSSVTDAGTSGKQFDSLQSIGESSGYESMKYRPDDDESSQSDVSQMMKTAANDSGFSTMVNQGSGSNQNNVTVVKSIEPWRVSRYKEDQVIEMEFTEDIFSQGTVSLGPFLTAIWSKLQTFTSNLLYVNIHLTGVISHISLYPLPLVHSILLRPDIPTTSDVPSFYQVLKILKQQIDAELPMTEESLELIDVGRTFLIDREFRLINARKIALEALKQTNNVTTNPSQLQSYDTFKRSEGKKRNAIMNYFRRPSNSTSSSSTTTTVNSLNNVNHQGEKNTIFFNFL